MKVMLTIIMKAIFCIHTWLFIAKEKLCGKETPGNHVMSTMGKEVVVVVFAGWKKGSEVLVDQMCCIST